VDRHPVLRTALIWQGLTAPLQVVQRQAQLPWEEQDWRAPGLQGYSDPRRSSDRLRTFIHQDRQRGFDFTHAPLMRWTLAHLAEDSHLLIWSYHHLILDGWSLPLLIEECFELYGSADPSPPTPRPFSDYFAWRETRNPAEAEAFWRNTLAGFRAATPLPADRAIAADDPGREKIETTALRFEETTTEGLKSLARRHRITLNTLIQAAWAWVLSQFSGQLEILFGATLSGRPAELPGVEKMVGLFINTLPVRVSTQRQGRLLQWLTELQAWNIEMRQYEDSRLFDLHSWSDIPAGQALFESGVLFQNYPQRATTTLTAAGLEARNFRSFGTTSYPMTLITKPGSQLRLSLGFDHRKFDRSTAKRMLLRVDRLLKRFVAEPNQRLESLDSIPKAERHQLLIEWNDGPPRDRLLESFPRIRSAKSKVHSQTITALISSHARRTPDSIAVVFQDHHLTYGALELGTQRLAASLSARGVGPESVVGLLMVRSLEMITAICGILKAGAAYVPLDPLFPKQRLALILKEASASVVLTLRRLEEDLPPTANVVICLDERPENGRGSKDSTFEAGAPANMRQLRPKGASRPRDSHTQALAYIIYTSGSTGTPKGVAISQDSLTSYVNTAVENFELAACDRLLQFASISFDTSAEEIFPTLVRGATLLLRSETMLESPKVFLETCQRWRVSVLDLPTAYWHEMTASLDSQHVLLPSTLRLVIIGGERANRDQLERWRRHTKPEVRLLNTYGPTEATIVATQRELDGPRTNAPEHITIGTAISGVQAHVLSIHGHPAPRGVAGEICLAGNGLARGYLRHPASTAAQFVPNPYTSTPGARLYKTGDQGRRTSSGELEILGRFDHQIKLRGLRIELGEIERSLCDHPDVAAAIVIADVAKQPPQRLIAYVQPSGASPTGTQLRKWLKQTLPFYMLPAVYVPLRELPKTVAGKIDRRALPKPPLNALETETYQAPRGRTETALADIWAETLSVRRVGRTDDYFDLGGHSLLAVRLMARIEQHFDIELNLALLFRDFTVRGLARVIDTAR